MGITRRNFICSAGAALCFALLGHSLDFRTVGASVLPLRQSPLISDTQNKSVYIYTEISLKNLQRKNPHWGIVARNGKLSDRAIRRAYCDVLDFHDALINIGAKPGNNLTEDQTGQPVNGDMLHVTAFWEASGRHHSLREIIDDSTGRGFTIRFGGNRETALKEQSGCIMCLESCWVRITSNAEYPT